MEVDMNEEDRQVRKMFEMSLCDDKSRQNWASLITEFESPFVFGRVVNEKL